MNAHLRRTFYLFTLGFVTLVAVLAYWQVYAKEPLANGSRSGRTATYLAPAIPKPWTN